MIMNVNFFQIKKIYLLDATFKVSTPQFEQLITIQTIYKTRKFIIFHCLNKKIKLRLITFLFTL